MNELIHISLFYVMFLYNLFKRKALLVTYGEQVCVDFILDLNGLSKIESVLFLLINLVYLCLFN